MTLFSKQKLYKQMTFPEVIALDFIVLKIWSGLIQLNVSKKKIEQNSKFDQTRLWRLIIKPAIIE